MTQAEMRWRIDLELELPPGTRLRLIRSPDWHRWPQGTWFSLEEAWQFFRQHVAEDLLSEELATDLPTFRRDLAGLTGLGLDRFAFAIVRPGEGPWGFDGPPPSLLEIEAIRSQHHNEAPLDPDPEDDEGEEWKRG